VKEARANPVNVPLALDRPWSGVVADYVALTKPRLNLLVVVTSAAGYYLGSNGAPELLPIIQVAAGTALVAGGSAVLNQVSERDTDALMRRTRARPLPDGRVTPADARTLGIILAISGLGLLAMASLLAALLALATLVIYVAIYTPMKRRSSLATLVGAVPGALPPLIGWAAGHGTVSLGGWALFGIVFLWQIPHFMAIAWMYRDDYSRAGFPMLPVLEPDGRRTGRQAVLYSAALLPVSTLPAFVGIAGQPYLWVALVLGALLLWLSSRFAAARSDAAARALFYGSLIYLPLVWVVMVLDHPV
jgi:protoheme IX farnesyltransferase